VEAGQKSLRLQSGDTKQSPDFSKLTSDALARELDKAPVRMVRLGLHVSSFEAPRRVERPVAPQRAVAPPSEMPTSPMQAPRFSKDSFTSAPAPTPSAVRRSALQRGMTGGMVRELQRHLVAEGLLRSSDVATGPGVFGPRTEAAVRRFQEREGLPVSGMVGPQTWSALLGDGFKPARPEVTVTEVPQTLDLSVTRPLESVGVSISSSPSVRARSND
jgi:hypothetical protein